jgi:glutaredoxin
MFIVIGRNDCGFCTAAQELLQNRHQDYKYYNITTYDKSSKLWSKKPKEHLTVPVIFDSDSDGNCDVFIGGYKELCIYLSHTS